MKNPPIKLRGMVQLDYMIEVQRKIMAKQNKRMRKHTKKSKGF